MALCSLIFFIFHGAIRNSDDEWADGRMAREDVWVEIITGNGKIVPDVDGESEARWWCHWERVYRFVCWCWELRGGRKLNRERVAKDEAMDWKVLQFSAESTLDTSLLLLLFVSGTRVQFAVKFAADKLAEIKEWISSSPLISFPAHLRTTRSVFFIKKSLASASFPQTAFPPPAARTFRRDGFNPNRRYEAL